MDARIIVTEKISDAGMEALTRSARVEAAIGIDRDALLDRIGEFDALVVRSNTIVDRELLDRAEKLRVVGRAGVGVDNIDIPAATSKGVVVVNAPESNILSAAEHTMALMLAISRKLPIVDREFKAGRWSKAVRHGVELFGKTLGIVGLGRVGSAVAVRAASFGMRLIAYDPYISDDRFRMFGAERVVTLEELLSRSDYVTVHTPKTEETYGMIGDRELALASDGVRVINTARGGIIVEDALVRAIESGKVAGAGIDVFEEEPVESHPLFRFEEVVVSPHLGGSTEEAQVRVGAAVAEQVIEALEGRLPRFALNIPAIDAETLGFIGPFLPLADVMGSLYTQLFGLPTEEAGILYGGEIGRYHTELATSAFLMGLLRTAAGDRVNLVNAAHVAESRGLNVTESRTADSEIYTSAITLRGRDGARAELVGTLSGEGAPRIVGIDGFEVDLVPVGDVLVLWHDGVVAGRPGIVGRIGTVLGDAGVNIKRMEVGRQVIGGRAIMVISPDGVVPEGTIDLLTGLPELIEARLVRLGNAARGPAGAC